MLEFLVFVAAAGSLAAALAYIHAMFKGQTMPNRVTWFMWSVAPFIATAAAISNGVGLAIIPVFMSGFSPFLIFTASFFTKKAYWKLSSIDYLCGALSGLALILWFLTKEPNVAIIFAIVSDAFAAIPTLIKAWHNPQTESSWPYIVGILSPMTSYLVVTAFTFSALAFSTYLVAINIVIAISVLAKRKQGHRAKAVWESGGPAGIRQP
jgi:hypothetical protein